MRSTCTGGTTTVAGATEGADAVTATEVAKGVSRASASSAPASPASGISSVVVSAKYPLASTSSVTRLPSTCSVKRPAASADTRAAPAETVAFGIGARVSASTTTPEMGVDVDGCATEGTASSAMAKATASRLSSWNS